MPTLAEPSHFAVRKTDNQKAVVFIHGFHGDAHQTFGMLPAFLAGSPLLYGWDIHCFGYPTGLAPDITGVWAADPDLTVLAGYLNGVLGLPPFESYGELALIAHSMGGLIVQRALLDGHFASRTRHVVLFGTPSGGLRNAKFGRWFKRQARDMVYNGEFITKLRADWNSHYNGVELPGFCTVAGLRDDFVPVESSVEPFAQSYRRFVAGNHLEMVKPSKVDSDTTELLLHLLSVRAPGARLMAPPSESFARTVDQFLPANRPAVSVPDSQVVKLALALEMTGRQDQAVALLEDVHTRSTELTGVLAGRLKRYWLANPQGNKADGERSYSLYVEAFKRAKEERRPDQAFYNGINVAFLTLTLKENLPETQGIAREVIEYCKLSPADKWRLATEGEASLYLGEVEAALASYTAALTLEPDPREIDSMHRQAVWAVRALGDDAAEVKLQALFDNRVLPPTPEPSEGTLGTAETAA